MRSKLFLNIFGALFLSGLFLACTSANKNPPSQTSPEGSEKTSKTGVLEAGAKALQSKEALSGFDIHLVGFHPMKDRPELQMEAHHLCKQVNEDFAQCTLFDGNSSNANLNGIEYIISEKLFRDLPAQEKEFWHPHNYEILSGQLVGPGLPEIAEKELMRKKINSYGKTWHVWNTGHFEKADADKLPLGPAHLAWSFNRDGEALPGLVEQMENKVNIRTADKKASRQDLVLLAKSQEGVDTLKNRFKRKTKSIPGAIQAK